MSAFLENKKRYQAVPIVVKGEDAADQIGSLAHESLSIVGFNTTEAERLGLEKGDDIKVAPEDTGNSSLIICRL
jgi:hypothetical protein